MRLAKFIIALLLSSVICHRLSLPASAQTLPPCGQGQANGLSDNDIDHYDLACFTSIPDAYITAASQMDFLFVDRSVGANIDTGLNCLGAGTPYASASNTCKSGLTASAYISHPKYNRSRWLFAHYGDGGWYDNVRNYINNQNLIDINRQPITPNYGSMEIMNFQFSYLSVTDPTLTNPTSGFFAPYPGNVNQIRDIHDMAAFEAALPNTRHVYATTSLARTIGTQIAQDFNQDMRAYAQLHQIPLIDFADIGSHSPSGTYCSYNGFAALCADYTTEPVGGHLSEGIALQRVAAAMWLMAASLSGWSPGGSSTPPPASPTPNPADLNGDGVIDWLDYLYLLAHFNSPYTIFNFNHLVRSF